MKKYILIIVIFLVFLSQQALACKCAGPGSYDVIFEGTVLKIEERLENRGTNHYAKVFFKVEKAIKGVAVPIITIYTGTVATCGEYYKVGDRRTVYALKDKYLYTRYCFGRELH